MNFYAVANGINSILALSIVITILIRKGNKPIHLTYAFFSLLLFSWAFSYFVWGFQKDSAIAVFWLQCVMLPTCFIHVAYFHFALIFSTIKTRSYKYLLTFGYLSSVVFCFMSINNMLFDSKDVRAIGPFRYWPHASNFLIVLIAIQLFFFVNSMWILLKNIKYSTELQRMRTKYFIIFAMMGWLGGLTNWFYWYDAFPIPPIGNIVVTFYMIGTTYLIFKHDILGLNLVIRKTFLYALLALFITLTYTIFIFIFEKLFQSIVGYNSFIATLFAAVTIALLFNQLRAILSKMLDRFFFGKDIEELSIENILMKSELEKQDKLKAVATLASGMAHEIKNPLTSIKTFAEYLPEKYDDPDFRDKFTRIVVDEVDRVNNIVKQLLEFSKPEVLTLKKESIASILDDTLNLLNNNLLTNKIEVIKKYNEEVLLSVDKNQLKQVFLNIFLNSIQAMSNGGDLTISTSHNHDSLLITVSDTGAGISREQLSHVFDPFFTTKESGTGLGLSIVHGIITKHGGKIQIESAENKGTTVSVTLKNQS